MENSIKITTKQVNAECIITTNETGAITQVIIRTGAKLGEIKNLTDKQALNARSSNPENPTTKDLVFTSASAAASFLQGSTIGGQRYFKKYLGETIEHTETKEEEKQVKEAETPKDQSALRFEVYDKIITFCKDFELKPDPRTMNSLIYAKDIDNLLIDFMQLTNYDSELVDMAKSKFKSAEWKEIKKQLKLIKPTHDQINQRLAIYYGSAGTGKTTTAIQEYPEAVKIVGSASQDPDDLFTRFDPSSKDYVLTEIGNAMIDGKPIIIDEGNLFNQVVWQRLQGCLDNTNKVSDRNRELTIKDGFKVIVTMNLETNLGKTPLPNPVVSRAKEIRNFDLNTFDKSAEWCW